MDKLKLSKPIQIDGVEVKEIPYDLEGMTAQDKINAGKEHMRDGNTATIQEIDSTYHLYLFAAAAKKVNSQIVTQDILRMNAKDSIKAETLVRNFFYLDSEDTSQTNISSESSPN